MCAATLVLAIAVRPAAASEAGSANYLLSDFGAVIMPPLDGRPQEAQEEQVVAVRALAVSTLSLLAARATAPGHQFQAERDPLERTNRGIYKFNTALDRGAVKPAIKVYRAAIAALPPTGPSFVPVRYCTKMCVIGAWANPSMLLAAAASTL
jgi:hypothetical protein